MDVMAVVILSCVRVIRRALRDPAGTLRPTGSNERKARPPPTDTARHGAMEEGVSGRVGSCAAAAAEPIAARSPSSRDGTVVQP